MVVWAEVEQLVVEEGMGGVEEAEVQGGSLEAVVVLLEVEVQLLYLEDQQIEELSIAEEMQGVEMRVGMEVLVVSIAIRKKMKLTADVHSQLLNELFKKMDQIKVKNFIVVRNQERSNVDTLNGSIMFNKVINRTMVVEEALSLK